MPLPAVHQSSTHVAEYTDRQPVICSPAARELASCLLGCDCAGRQQRRLPRAPAHVCTAHMCMPGCLVRGAGANLFWETLGEAAGRWPRFGAAADMLVPEW